MAAAPQNLDQLSTHGVVVAQEVTADGDFREKWARLALARAVAGEVLRYRADNELTQTQLATQLGMKQPQIARLESGETQPDPDTIARVMGAIGAELAVDYTSTEKAPTLLTKRARERAIVGQYRCGDGAVVIALARRSTAR